MGDDSFHWKRYPARPRYGRRSAHQLPYVGRAGSVGEKTSAKFRVISRKSRPTHIRVRFSTTIQNFPTRSCDSGSSSFRNRPPRNGPNAAYLNTAAARCHVVTTLPIRPKTGAVLRSGGAPGESLNSRPSSHRPKWEIRNLFTIKITI